MDAPKIATVLYWVAALFMIIAAMVTRFGNQPLNGIVMQWNGMPPAGWEGLRDRWWGLHQARLAAGVVAVVLLIMAVLMDRARQL